MFLIISKNKQNNIKNCNTNLYTLISYIKHCAILNSILQSCININTILAHNEWIKVVIKLYILLIFNFNYCLGFINNSTIQLNRYDINHIEHWFELCTELYRIIEMQLNKYLKNNMKIIKIIQGII